MFGIVITSGTDGLFLSHVAGESELLSLSLSVCGAHGQELVPLWGLGLFNEVVICPHRGSPVNLESSLCQAALFRNVWVSLMKVDFTPSLESCTSNTGMCFMRWHPPVMLPPLGLYMSDLLLTSQPILMALHAWGQLVARVQTRLCPIWLGCLCSAAVCPKNNINMWVRWKGPENTSHSAACLKC